MLPSPFSQCNERDGQMKKHRFVVFVAMHFFWCSVCLIEIDFVHHTVLQKHFYLANSQKIIAVRCLNLQFNPFCLLRASFFLALFLLDSFFLSDIRLISLMVLLCACCSGFFSGLIFMPSIERVMCAPCVCQHVRVYEYFFPSSSSSCLIWLAVCFHYSGYFALEWPTLDCFVFICLLAKNYIFNLPVFFPFVFLICLLGCSLRCWCFFYYFFRLACVSVCMCVCKFMIELLGVVAAIEAFTSHSKLICICCKTVYSSLFYMHTRARRQLHCGSMWFKQKKTSLSKFSHFIIIILYVSLFWALKSS